MLETVLAAFDEQITAHEGAASSRKAVAATLKGIDKLAEAVAMLPEDLRSVVAVDADVVEKLKGFNGGDASDLQAMANKLHSALGIVEDLGDGHGFDVERATALLERYKALGPTRIGSRDGSSRKGVRNLPGVIEFTFPDGTVRHSSGDMTSVRYELRDHADKVQNARIATNELNQLRDEIVAAATAQTAVSTSVEDSDGNEYAVSYTPSI